ncbi:ubiquitin-conjugating enzyme/RWD-like protein [Nemania serpens]|nr:ubiquitin-conjugating enzyme/RWD-like protein [Nemania serpens]
MAISVGLVLGRKKTTGYGIDLQLIATWDALQRNMEARAPVEDLGVDLSAFWAGWIIPSYASTFTRSRPAVVHPWITNNLPPGIALVSADNLEEWFLDIQVLDQNPLYVGHIYRLKFKFSNNYPIEAPEVTFVKLDNRPIPMHPHIYSNGIICLDLLGSQGWSPVQSVESVCMSIQSMLTGNTKNERPPGDEEFVRGNRQRPRDIAFYYHDNTV